MKRVYIFKDGVQNASLSIDLDYNLEIVRCEDFEDRINLKECARKSFNKALNERDLGDCEDSTSSLTTELKEMGVANVRMDEHGYIYGEIPANTEEKITSLGFIAHMDTSPALSGKDVKPQFVENYDGGDICLNKEKDIWLLTSDFPEMKNYKGKTDPYGTRNRLGDEGRMMKQEELARENDTDAMRKGIEVLEKAAGENMEGQWESF